MNDHQMTRQITSMFRITLAVAFATTLAACEDTPPPPSKARPSVTEAPPTSGAKPTPPAPPAPVVPAPSTPVATPEVKPEPIVVEAEDDTKNVDALTAARKKLDAGDVDKALELAQLAVRATPKRSAAWNVLGRAQLRAGKRKSAIESFERAVELNPRNSYARNNLGLAFIYDKHFDEAVDALEEAVELEPVTPYMWNNLGMAYEQLDRLEEARDAYSKAASMESDRARDSLTRLKGVESVVRTAKAEPEMKLAPGPAGGTNETTASRTKDKESRTVTQ